MEKSKGVEMAKEKSLSEEIREMRKAHCRDIMNFLNIYKKLSINDYPEDIRIMKKALPYMSTAIIDKAIWLIKGFPEEKLEGFSLEEISLVRIYSDRNH